MTLLASGIYKQLLYKKQTALGTKATVGSAQLLRRVTSTLAKSKATYVSKEIRPSMQRSDFRHGIVAVAGTVSGELSVGTYGDFMSSMLRQAWQTASTSGALTTVTSAVTTGAAGTYTRTGGSFITDGFAVGSVVRWTGWTAPAAANNAHNFLITSLTALVMTGIHLDGVPVVAKAAGDSVTALEAGKSTWIPTTGQTRDYYTIEHNFSDIVQSEQFKDCVPSQMDVKLPPSGMATVDFQFMGIDMDTSTSAYFTSPTGATTSGILAAVNGALFVQGLQVGLITGLNFTVKGNYTKVGGVVGANVEPDIVPGAIDVSGQVTIVFTDGVMRDYFINETEVSIVCAFTTSGAANADFQSYTFPRCKMGGATKDDGEKALIMTMPFTALENVAGQAGYNTTVIIQDSLIP
jgi:Phage tail tube protein